MRLDLPAPLGPMMEVKFLNGPMTWCPLLVDKFRNVEYAQEPTDLYDLKSHNSMRIRGIFNQP
jgi:hypothetical protein